MTRAIVSEKWRVWVPPIGGGYDDDETISPFLSLFQGAVTDLGVGQAGALVHLVITSGGVEDTTFKIYPAAQLPGESPVRDTEAQTTITLPTAANAILRRSFWVSWENVGDGFHISVKNATGTDPMILSAYYKRLWTP